MHLTLLLDLKDSHSECKQLLLSYKTLLNNTNTTGNGILLHHLCSLQLSEACDR